MEEFVDLSTDFVEIKWRRLTRKMSALLVRRALRQLLQLVSPSRGMLTLAVLSSSIFLANSLGFLCAATKLACLLSYAKTGLSSTAFFSVPRKDRLRLLEGLARDSCVSALLSSVLPRPAVDAIVAASFLESLPVLVKATLELSAGVKEAMGALTSSQLCFSEASAEAMRSEATLFQEGCLVNEVDVILLDDDSAAAVREDATPEREDTEARGEEARPPPPHARFTRRKMGFVLGSLEEEAGEVEEDPPTPPLPPRGSCRASMMTLEAFLSEAAPRDLSREAPPRERTPSLRGEEGGGGSVPEVQKVPTH